MIINSVAVIAIAGDGSSPVTWRSLRCFAVVIDAILLTLFATVIDVAATFAINSFNILNTLATLVGFFQFAQPWTLYIIATYVHRLLLGERHRVPPQRRVRCPLVQLMSMIVAGSVYFSVFLPPFRVLLYRSVASHRTLCTVPLFDQWQLSVGNSATNDLFYYLGYDCLYALIVYVAPIVPLYYRYRRLVDAVFRRDYQTVVVRSGSRAASLGSWADVVSVTCGVHIVTHCIKSTMLTMRLTEAITVDKYMAAGDNVFQLLNVIANVTTLVRPICHLPVMIVYDHRVRSASIRAWHTVHAFVANVLSYLKRNNDHSDYSFESVELDSIVADDAALDNEDTSNNAVSV